MSTPNTKPPEVYHLLSAAAAQGAGSEWRNLDGAPGLAITVNSETTSVATVEIQQSNNRKTWVTVAMISNPAAAGSVYLLPGLPYTRANITAWTSGAISVVLSALSTPITWAGPIGGSAQTFGALAVSSLADSGLTATRIPFAGVAGLLGDDSTLTFNSTTKALGAAILKGGKQSTIAAKLTDGAIASAPGTIAITKGSALGASTLATPTVTDHDGYVLRIVSTTAFAHVISVASGKVNGGANTTITFTSGAIGDSIVLEAYQGVWYTVSKTGTITIS